MGTTTCDISCQVNATEVNASCDDISIDIPEIPSSVDDIAIPSVDEVTTEDVDGTGAFDIYMRAGMNQLMTQYNAGRIKGADFATVYIQLVQLMMTEANKFVLGKVQAEIAAKMFPIQYLTAGYDAATKESTAKKTEQEVILLCQQIAELKANGGVERGLKEKQTQVQIKQAELYNRQIKGFGEKAASDAAKIIMDAWAVSAVEEPDATVYGTGLEKGGNAPGALNDLLGRR